MKWMPLLSRRVLTSLRCDLHSKKLAEDVANVAAGSIVVGLRAAVDTSRHAPRHAMEPPKRNSGADPLVRGPTPSSAFVTRRKKPARGPAADQGVRPTVSQAPQTRVS